MLGSNLKGRFEMYCMRYSDAAIRSSCWHRALCLVSRQMLGSFCTDLRLMQGCPAYVKHMEVLVLEAAVKLL